MIIAIRISGMVKVTKEVEEALHRIRLRRKYAAVLLKQTAENTKLLKKIRNHISYGEIDKKTLEDLIKQRGQLVKGKKIEADKIVAELGNKSLSDLGLKPFFRLHPPRGGIESKKHAGVGKGVLGENKKINELVRRML